MNENPAAVMANSRSKPIGKSRNPWVVLILSIVTFGIYNIVWHYSILEELKNWRGQGWSGLVFIIFFLIFGIALIAIPWLVPAYVGRMYAEDGQAKPITGLTGFWVLLPIIGGVVWLFKVQNNLNAFWEAKM